MDVFYYSELCNMKQCEAVTLEMHSQMCIAFYFKFSALWPLRLRALEVRYLLIYIKPHRKRGDNKLGTLLITSWTLKFHKLSPHRLIQKTLNIQRNFEDSGFMSSSRNSVSRINNEKLDADLRSSYNNLCIYLEHTNKSAMIFLAPHKFYRHFTVLTLFTMAT
jgi:sRNA-binding regulator protein Hfq